MSPLLKRAVDTAIAVALTIGIVFVVIVTSNLLQSRGGSWQGVKAWMALMAREDILGTIVLTALVTMTYVFFQQTKRTR